MNLVFLIVLILLDFMFVSMELSFAGFEDLVDGFSVNVYSSDSSVHTNPVTFTSTVSWISLAVRLSKVCLWSSFLGTFKIETDICIASDVT